MSNIVISESESVTKPLPLPLDTSIIEDYLENILDHVRSDQDWSPDFKCPHCQKNLEDLSWDGKRIEQTIYTEDFTADTIEKADAKCPNCLGIVDIASTYEKYATVLREQAQALIDRARGLRASKADKLTEPLAEPLKRKGPEDPIEEGKSFYKRIRKLQYQNCDNATKEWFEGDGSIARHSVAEESTGNQEIKDAEPEYNEITKETTTNRLLSERPAVLARSESMVIGIKKA